MKYLFSGLLAMLLVAAAGLTSGCASYSAHEHTRYLQRALQDDATCTAQGLRFPQPRYVTCRMNLQDARLHRDWLNLQLMHQTQPQPTGMSQAYPYHEVYRPLDRDHFHCHVAQENSQTYVLCGEDDNDS